MRKMIEICGRTEHIYAKRLLDLGQKTFPRHKYYFYGVHTANGLRYTYILNLTKDEYNALYNKVMKRQKFYGLV